jgi:RNA polymerase sigma factor for flagellar operon FliA
VDIFAKLPQGVTDPDDLISVATEALCQAVERYPSYCEARGFLAAYCARRINGAILDWSRSNDTLTRSQRDLVRAVEEEQAEHGGTAVEAARRAGLDPRAARAAVDASALQKPGVSLDEGGGPDTPGERLAGDTPAADSQMFVSELLAAASKVINGLDETSRTILVLRYYEGLTLRTIAAALLLEEADARRRWERAVLRIHDRLLLAASVPGDGGCSCSSGGRCMCGR